MLTRRAVVSIIVSVTALLAGPMRTSAEVICSRVLLKRNKVTQSIQKVTSGRPCPKGFAALLDTASIVGTAGERGPAGSDAPSIYGDGSAGDFVAASGTNFLNPVNPQYANFTVGASSTVIIPSGSVIRVSGVLRNEGIIFIDWSSNSGLLEIGSPTGLLAPAAAVSDQGLGFSPPASGEIGNILGHRRVGGGGGAGLAGSSYPQGAAPLFLPGLRGGASGAPIYSGSSGQVGGPGGGSAVFLVGGAATNSGNMRAMGEVGASGSGGGAGGILIVASATSISNSGSVTVQGSAGGNSTASCAPGGGGGGGVVKFIAPSITNSGSVNISGGAAGTRSVTTASVVPVSAGGGGGGSAGSGGAGGLVNADNSYGLASAGSEGNFIPTQMDPAIFYR